MESPDNTAGFCDAFWFMFANMFFRSEESSESNRYFLERDGEIPETVELLIAGLGQPIAIQGCL